MSDESRVKTEACGYYDIDGQTLCWVGTTSCSWMKKITKLP